MLRRHFFFSVLALSSLSSAAFAGAPPGAAEHANLVVEQSTRFGLAVFNASATDANLVFSPLSVFDALSMTSAGAAGKTLEAMRAVLGSGLSEQQTQQGIAYLQSQLTSRAAGQIQLKVANRLFVDNSLSVLPEFLSVTRTSFGAEVGRLDFASALETARTTINAWVAENTGSHIKELLHSSDLTRDSRLVLANAIWLNADWQRPFKKEATSGLPFLVDGKRPIEVPTMSQTMYTGYGKAHGAAWVELPYGPAGRFSLLVGLPDAANGLAALRKSLDAGGLASAVAGMSQTSVAIKLPKFKLDTRLALKEALKSMGMAAAFGDEADFSRMSKASRPADQLRIDKVIHQAVMVLDEKGTEAAAATAVVMGRKGAVGPSDEPVPFRVDHPFMFFLRDVESGRIIFIGQVVNPAG